MSHFFLVLVFAVQGGASITQVTPMPDAAACQYMRQHVSDIAREPGWNERMIAKPIFSECVNASDDLNK